MLLPGLAKKRNMMRFGSVWFGHGLLLNAARRLGQTSGGANGRKETRPDPSRSQRTFPEEWPQEDQARLRAEPTAARRLGQTFREASARNLEVTAAGTLHD